jgi:hypothetical protein
MDKGKAPVIIDNLVEDTHEGIVIEDDKEEDDNIGANEAADDDTLEDEDPVPEESDKVFPLHDDVEDARSDDSDGNKDARSDASDGDNKVDNDNGIAEDPMELEEDKAESARYNLRPNWERTYDKLFVHSMDNPASSKSYDVQFLQQGESTMPSLREAVEVMMGSGSSTEVLSYITGFIMT